MCEFFGFDPLYVANEGKIVFIVAEKDASQILLNLQKHKYGKNAAIIGTVVSEHPGTVVLQTKIGGNVLLICFRTTNCPEFVKRKLCTNSQ